MWVMTLLMLAALAINIDLRDSGDAYRPFHILVCGPLALYCAVVGCLKWLKD